MLEIFESFKEFPRVFAGFQGVQRVLGSFRDISRVSESFWKVLESWLAFGDFWGFLNSFGEF